MWGYLIAGNKVTYGCSRCAVNDRQTCAQKCESHSQCVAWMVIYGIPAYDGSRSAMCYLKTGGNITLVLGVTIPIFPAIAVAEVRLNVCDRRCDIVLSLDQR